MAKITLRTNLRHGVEAFEFPLVVMRRLSGILRDDKVPPLDRIEAMNAKVPILRHYIATCRIIEKAAEQYAEGLRP